MRILLVEDDQSLSQVIRQSLEQDDHQVTVSRDGSQAITLAQDHDFDLLVLDRMLPTLDGLQVATAVRRIRDVPIIFLTARSSLEDKLKGLELADDYLTKPFALAELKARINAVVRRRSATPSQSVLRFLDLCVDLHTREVTRGKMRITLYNVEFRILCLLMQNPRQVVTRSMIAEHVWGLDFPLKSSIVQTNISRLRAKIDQSSEQPLIHTVRGVGYILTEAP